MNKKLIISVLTILLPIVTNAQHVEIKGIQYNLNGEVAEVISGVSFPTPASYSGSVVIPEKVKNRGSSYRVTSIGNLAFYKCTSLTSVTIPNSVTSIGKAAFRGCSGLTSVTIPNGVTSIGDSAFVGCSGLTSVTIPNSVTSIGQAAFRGCSGLTSVTIPNSVTSIGKRVFMDCSGLTSVTIPNSVTSIGQEAFRYCSGLISVTIPNSVTSIGQEAFIGCSSLTSVTIPSSVTSFGSDVFEGCDKLELSKDIMQKIPRTAKGVLNGNMFKIQYPDGSVVTTTSRQGYKYVCFGDSLWISYSNGEEVYNDAIKENHFSFAKYQEGTIHDNKVCSKTYDFNTFSEQDVKKLIEEKVLPLYKVKEGDIHFTLSNDPDDPYHNWIASYNNGNVTIKADAEAKRLEDVRKEYNDDLNALKKKYGAKYVDAALNGKLLVGMPLDLLASDFWNYYWGKNRKEFSSIQCPSYHYTVYKVREILGIYKVDRRGPKGLLSFEVWCDDNRKITRFGEK